MCDVKGYSPPPWIHSICIMYKLGKVYCCYCYYVIMRTMTITLCDCTVCWSVSTLIPSGGVREIYINNDVYTEADFSNPRGVHTQQLQTSAWWVTADYSVVKVFSNMSKV